MAGLDSDVSEQLRAVAAVRFRLFVNSLRSFRGRANLFSRIVAALLITIAAVGGAFALGATGWELTRAGKLEWLGVFFWIISFFWQFFPLMASAFTQNIDTTALLRFPLTYRGYFLVRMIFGALDIATALGFTWSVGLCLGVAFGSVSLVPWALLALLSFAAFNLLLARMIFVWIEHWLSRRRSREVLGLIFFVLMIGFQFVGPALNRYSKRPLPQRVQVLLKLAPVERSLPPGLAAGMLQRAAEREIPAAFLAMAGIWACSAVALFFLHLRLRQQYAGENPDSASGTQNVVVDKGLRRGWSLPFAPASVSAVFEKEIRYLSRSGPMLFTMIMPMVMVILLWGSRSNALGNRSDFFFPIGAGYCLLVMTNVIYNSFGADGGGVQSLLLSPVSFRRIVLAKNLAHLAVLIAEVLLLGVSVILIYHTPPLSFFAATLAWYLFAAPLNFAAGNLLSLYQPKRVDYAIFGRQRASETTIFISLFVQLAVMGLGGLAIYLGYRFSNMWLAVMALGAIAIPAIATYVILLNNIDRIVIARREVLASELCKA